MLQEDRTAAKTEDRDLVVTQTLGASHVSTLHIKRGERRGVCSFNLFLDYLVIKSLPDLTNQSVWVMEPLINSRITRIWKNSPKQTNTTKAGQMVRL